MYICSSTFKIPCQLRNIKTKFLHCLIGPTKEATPHLALPVFPTFPKDIIAANVSFGCYYNKMLPFYDRTS